MSNQACCCFPNDTKQNYICTVNKLPKTKLPRLDLSFYEMGLETDVLEDIIAKDPVVAPYFKDPLTKSTDVFLMIRKILSVWTNEILHQGVKKEAYWSSSDGFLLVYLKSNENNHVLQQRFKFNPVSSYNNRFVTNNNLNFDESDVTYNPDHVIAIQSQVEVPGVDFYSSVMTTKKEFLSTFRLCDPLTTRAEVQQANNCRYGYATRINYETNAIQYFLAKKIEISFGVYFFLEISYEIHL